MKDFKLMSKHEFIQLFHDYLYPEQIGELMGGYYDGDTMLVHDLGIEVEVTPSWVLIKKEDWEKIKDKLGSKS